MNWKQVLFSGAATGALVALLMVLNVRINVAFDSFGTAVISFLGIILISAFIVKKTAQTIGCCEPSLKHLIPVAFLTFIIPVLGPIFGAPNMGLEVVVTIIFMGAIGGLFWSTPFAIWSYFKSRGNESISDKTGEEE
jgi:hypothetical protein